MLSPIFIDHAPDLRVYRVPAYKDNYLWIVHHPDACLLVDPGEEAPMLKALETLSLKPDAILVTHKHWDHVSGVDPLAQRFNARVYAPHGISGCQAQQLVEDGRVLTFGELCVRVIALPGHTLEHVGYAIERADPPLVFVGDTLFGAGCGRMFEGEPAQMWQSIKHLLALPENTLVYCAHEYTRANLRFALEIEPDNLALVARARKVDLSAKATIPTSLALEMATNPFCRVRELAQGEKWQGMDEAALFGTLRRMKDNFQG